MRFVIIVGLLLSDISALAATYETVDGRRRTLKTVSGEVHQRKGHMGPGENLRWADLSKADLGLANLRFSDLRNTNLGQSRLTNANLNGVLLGGADISGADLAGARLRRAELDGANFRGVKNWEKADWKDAHYTEGAEPRWPQGMNPAESGIVVKKSMKNALRK